MMLHLLGSEFLELLSVYFLGNVATESAKDRREFGTKNMVYLHSFIWQQKRFVADYV
jgi:hypothetical protein